MALTGRKRRIDELGGSDEEYTARLEYRVITLERRVLELELDRYARLAQKSVYQSLAQTPRAQILLASPGTYDKIV